MFQLAQPASFEQTIKKSRFIAHALAIADEDEAKETIARLRDEAASHNCWAWRLGNAYRFFDDGEPSGTAGKPILAAIDGQQMDRVLVVVTRWFGGILLGSGGLVRAYGGTAAACLRQANKIEVRPTVEAVVNLDFADLARVKARLQAVQDVTIFSETFRETGANLVLRLPEEATESVARLVRDLTSGRADLLSD